MAEKTAPSTRRVLAASLIGTAIEFYDFYVYTTAAALVFGELFFPQASKAASQLASLATIGVAFVARPLGSLFFGHFGDRVGRKSMLVMTLTIMGVATVLIGMVPTYAQIGIWAPSLLLLLRVLQGIGLGGEWGGAVLMAFEYAPANKRGFYASIPQIGLALGLCLSSGVVAGLSLTLTDAQFLAWGWRVAFFLSFALVLIGMYIRLNVMETPEFARIQKTGSEARMPIVDVISKYPGNTIAGMGARFIDGVFFNVFGVFSISYLTGTLHLQRTDALLGVMVAAFVMIFTIPFFGRLSDRIGRARIYFWGSLATGLSAFFGFWLMKNSGGNTMLAWLAVVIPLGVVYASIYGPEAALFSELFDAKVRYSGISFVYQFSGIFASGISPIVATWLLQRNGGDPWMIAGYCLAAGVISALSAAWVGRRQRRQTAFSMG